MLLYHSLIHYDIAHRIAVTKAEHKPRTTRTPLFWDTRRWPMITHTRDSHEIPSQNKTKSKLQILKKKITQNSNFEILQETLHVTHLLKLLDKMYKHEMDPTRTVGRYRADTGCGTDGQTDRWTEGVKPIYPPTTLLCGGYNKNLNSQKISHISSSWVYCEDLGQNQPPYSGTSLCYYISSIN